MRTGPITIFFKYINSSNEEFVPQNSIDEPGGKAFGCDCIGITEFQPMQNPLLDLSQDWPVVGKSFHVDQFHNAELISLEENGRASIK